MTTEPKLKRGYRSNDIIVNTKSSFKSHLVKCQELIDNIYFDEIVLKSMGKATVRAANLAIQLNLNNYNSFDLVPFLNTAEIYEDKQRQHYRGADKDGFNPDAIDIKTVPVTRVPVLEIAVRKNKKEIEKVRQFKLNKLEKVRHKRARTAGS